MEVSTIISLASLLGAMIGIYVRLQTRISILENDQKDHQKLIDENYSADKERVKEFDSRLTSFKEVAGNEIEKIKIENKRIEDKSDENDKEMRQSLKEEGEMRSNQVRRVEDRMNEQDKELRNTVHDDYRELSKEIRDIAIDKIKFKRKDE